MWASAPRKPLPSGSARINPSNTTNWVYMSDFDVVGISLSIAESFKDLSTVNTFLVVVSYLSFLKVILRAWEQRLLAPEPMLKTQGRKK